VDDDHMKESHRWLVQTRAGISRWRRLGTVLSAEC